MTQPKACNLALCVRHAVTLCLIARGMVSPYLIQAVINSAPRSADERQSEEWRENSLCWTLLIEGHYKHLHSWAQDDFDAAAAFWLEEFSVLPLAAQLALIFQVNNADDFYSSGKCPSDNPAVKSILEPSPVEAPQILLFPQPAEQPPLFE